MWDIFSRLFGTFERASPSDITPSSSIIKGNSFVKIKLDNLNIPFNQPPKVWLTTVQDTNSLDPVVDYLHTTILVQGVDEADQKVMLDFIKEGDIVVAQTVNYYVIHRVWKITQGKKGRRFQLKGDNNFQADSVKIEDKDIKWLLVGIIY